MWGRLARLDCTGLNLPIVRWKLKHVSRTFAMYRQRICIILVKWSNEYQFIVHKCINTSYKVIILCSETTPPVRPPALHPRIERQTFAQSTWNRPSPEAAVISRHPRYYYYGFVHSILNLYHKLKFFSNFYIVNLFRMAIQKVGDSINYIGIYIFAHSQCKNTI